jgi:hypothetical protein
VSSSLGGVSVQRTTLSFDSTASGSCRTNPAPLKLTQIFSFVIDFSKAALKAGRKASFLIYLEPYRAKLLILLPYARFKGEKQPTLSGCSRCDE